MSVELGEIDERIRFAIEHRRLVQVRFNGVTRIAEPHDYGVRKGSDRLLVFQLQGPWRRGQPAVGWRWYEVAKVEVLVVLDQPFEGSRGRAHRDHYAWDVLYARVR